MSGINTSTFMPSRKTPVPNPTLIPQQADLQGQVTLEPDRVRAAEASGRVSGTQAGTAIQTLQTLAPGLFGAGSSSSRSAAGSGIGRVAAPIVMLPNGYGSSGAGSGGGGVPAQLRPVDTEAADRAAFARAKDRVGQITRGSVTGLRSALANSGRLGSGAEDFAVSDVMSSGAGELSEVARELAIQEADRNQHRADLEFTGGITQRGQDISAKAAADALAARLAESTYQGEITQRGQDLASERDQLSFETEEKRQQQFVLDRILQALSLY